MKVKIKYDFRYVDEDEELDTISTIIFDKDKPYDVVFEFQSDRWGDYDHTVFVIINETGDTMSVSKEMCEIVVECEVSNATRTYKSIQSH